MADNPRHPDQNPDVPSSRHSGGMTNPPGSSGGNYTPPPPATASHSKLNVRNIMIGSIVTIATSTIIFYLTQYLKKPEGNEFEKMKKATTAAWKSYVGYENLYAQNIISHQKIGQQRGMAAYVEGVKKESEEFKKDIQDLQKRKNLDEDLLKMLGRRVENETSSFPIIEEYVKTITAIENSDKLLKEKKDDLTNAMIQYNLTVNGMFERSVNELKEIAKILAERYGGSFSEKDFLSVQIAPQMMKTNDSVVLVLMNVEMDSAGNVIKNKNFASNVDPDNLIGKWETEGAIITLSKDGKVSWVVSDGNKAEGKWKVEEDQLKVEATLSRDKSKVIWYFNLAYITANSFTILYDEPPYNLYKLTRTIGN